MEYLRKLPLKNPFYYSDISVFSTSHSFLQAQPFSNCCCLAMCELCQHFYTAEIAFLAPLGNSHTQEYLYFMSHFYRRKIVTFLSEIEQLANTNREKRSLDINDFCLVFFFFVLNNQPYVKHSLKIITC